MNGPHWIKQWIADLALLNDQFRNEDGSVDFSALGREEYQFRMALITRKFSNSERAKDIFEKAKAAYEVNVERGKKGGRPRKDSVEDGARESEQRTEANSGKGIKSAQAAPSHKDAAASVRMPAPRDKHEVMDFAEDNGLDVEDARLWYQRNYVERPGCDKDGEVIRNWRGALINACKAEETKRRTA
jgi:hypothetical protein